MDLQPVDFLQGLGGLGGLPHPYDDQQQVIQNQQAQQGNAQALQLGAAKLSAIAQQQQQAQQYQTDVAAALKNPSPQNFAALYAKYPEQHDALKQAWDAQDAPTKQANLTQLGNVFSYLSNGKPDLAAKSLQDRIDAEKSAGLDTSDDEQVLALITSGKPEDIAAAKGIAGMHLAAALGPEKYGETLKTLGLDQGGDKGFTLGEGQVRYDGGGHVIASGPAKSREPHYYTLKDANGVEHEFVDYGEGPQPTSGGGGLASGGAPSGSGGAPLSVRLNNPGAIRFSPTNQWQGQVGNQGGFVQFDTQANGDRAHRILIANQIKGGYDTPLTWAQHYAPASDGNDPAAYAQTVAQGLGIGVNDKIPLSAVPKMAAISARVESGGTPTAGRIGSVAPVVAGGPRQLDSTPFAQSATSDLSGPAFLASLPVSRRNYLQAVADGRIAAPRPGSKYGDQLAEQAANAFPGIDTTTFPARQSTRRDFTGNGKGAQNITALNRFYAHLNDAYDIHLRLGGANLGPLSGVAAGISQSFSPKDVRDYNVAIEGLQGEFQKLTKNGQGNESEAERLISAAKAAQSSEGRLGALQALAKLAAAQVEPLHAQWSAAFPERPIPIDITPASRAIYQNVVGAGSHAIAIDKNGTPIVPKNYKAGGTSAPSAPVKVTSRAQVMALPPGTQFIDPSGTLRVRP